MRKEKVWRTRDGTNIPFSKIDNAHLLNILTWIKRVAAAGISVEVEDGGIFGTFDEFPSEPKRTLKMKGKIVYEALHYDDLIEEAKKRKIIPKDSK